MPEMLKSGATGIRRIENFRGDFAGLSQMMERSWGENDGQALFYSPEFLASCFGYPGANFALAPSIYEGSSIVAFGAAFPRRVSLCGRNLNLAVITFLTAASEYKKRGYGVVVWNELVKRIRAEGFEGMVNYCVQGEPMNGMILGCCSTLQLPAMRVRSIPYWSRMLPPRKPQFESQSQSPATETISSFLELAAPIVMHAPLARRWTAAEAEWQCLLRDGATAAELECRGRRGMLTGYIIPVANASRTKCLMIDDVLWGNLQIEEQHELVRRLLDQAVAAGAQLAVLPVLGYASIDPFHAARFRPSQRVLHAYLSVWNGEGVRDALPSMYLDVF